MPSKITDGLTTLSDIARDTKKADLARSLVEDRIVDPDTGGEKGQKLQRFDLIPSAFLAELALVYGVGAQKYADDNWRKGYRWRLSLGALHRHLNAWSQGEDIDPETGLNHLAHVAWHCATLFTFQELSLGTDDIPERNDD